MYLPIVIKHRIPDWLVESALVDRPDTFNTVDADLVGTESYDGSETLVKGMESFVFSMVPA